MTENNIDVLVFVRYKEPIKTAFAKDNCDVVYYRDNLSIEIRPMWLFHEMVSILISKKQCSFTEIQLIKPKRK